MFLVHAFDDGALSSVILMNALKRANVPSELHLFGAGGHGFGVRDSGLPVAHWRELCLNWLRWLGYLDAAPIRAFTRDYQHAFASGAAKLPRFTGELPDSDLAQAYAAQRRGVQATVAQGGVIAGYKGAFTSTMAQKANGIAAAQHGVLFKDGWIETQSNPVVIKPDANRPLLVETEIGYVIAVDIGAKVMSPRQAMSAVEALRPVVELPVNTGSLMPGQTNALDLIAANVGSSRYLVGPPLPPAAIGATDALPVKLQYQGETLHKSTGADVTGSQAQNLMNLINEIIDQGHVLHRGDLIICGALGGAKPGKPGRYRAEYGPLGAIDFSIEP